MNSSLYRTRQGQSTDADFISLGLGGEAKGGEENAEKENENQFAALKKQFEQ